METERLVIRSFSPGDWRDLHEYLSREETVKYEPYDVYSEEQSRQEAARRAADGNFFAVCLKTPDKLIGNLYLSGQAFDAWELGYVFNAAYLGKGYATEAVRALLGHAFRELNARRIVAMCNPLNVRSWKLLERVGMRREGHLLKNIYFKKDKDGEPLWVDTYEYGMLASEWNGQAR